MENSLNKIKQTAKSMIIKKNLNKKKRFRLTHLNNKLINSKTNHLSIINLTVHPRTATVHNQRIFSYPVDLAPLLKGLRANPAVV